MCPLPVVFDQKTPTASVDALIIQISRLMAALNHKGRIAYLRQQEIPRFLYKFRAALPDSSRSIEDILLRSNLWLSSPNDFNDPFHMAAKIIVDSTAAERRKRFEEILKRSRVRSEKSVLETALIDLCILDVSLREAMRVAV
jgi:hypothetical protein